MADRRPDEGADILRLQWTRPDRTGYRFGGGTDEQAALVTLPLRNGHRGHLSARTARVGQLVDRIVIVDDMFPILDDVTSSSIVDDMFPTPDQLTPARSSTNRGPDPWTRPRSGSE